MIVMMKNVEENLRQSFMAINSVETDLRHRSYDVKKVEH
jgi:hypothetical protein